MELDFRESISERHVQALWYDSSMRPDRIFTRRGNEVRVVDPGEWNLEEGPDFKNAVLELGPDHRRIRGDVEVHLDPMDWERHRHGADPNYRNVIAHITWNCGPEPPSLPVGAVSIWLGRFLMHDIGFSPSMVDLSAYPFAKTPISLRPCYRSLQGKPDEARRILRLAGQHRLKMKSSRISKLRMARPDGDKDLFYEEVMNALGYKRNSRSFRAVARAVPLTAVLEEPDVAEAAYLAAADFQEWDVCASRPANSPHNRLKCAARLFTRTDTMSLTEAKDFSRDGCRKMMEILVSGHHLGKGRAAAIIANVVAPFAGAVPDWLPPEDISAPMRLTAFRLFGRDHNPALYAGNGVLLQGLMQIYRDFCLRLHPGCDACRIGNFEENA
jgi:hypothetical protein